MEYKGLRLDPFQENAIAALDHNKSVIVAAPTGSGKTLIADYLIDRDVKQNIQVVYTAPIKALSNQKYKDFVAAYGEERVGLLTGDTVKNADAPVLIMTTEIFRNMVITKDERIMKIQSVIFDEIHFINDPERGYVWEESIIFAPPHVRMLCLSATVPNADEMARWISAIKEHEVVVINHDKRPVPLHVHFFDTDLGLCTLKDIRDVIDIPDYKYLRGKRRERRPRLEPPSHIDLVKSMRNNLPCFYFVFSRMACQKKALELSRKNFFVHNKDITTYVHDRLKDAPTDINKLESTKILRQILPLGIGFHHAGLLPIMKDIVEELFANGMLRVLYTTETFAVGLNMPAKSVCFDSLRKFDGRDFRLLNSKEYFQIAGRAGRRGIDNEGHVYIAINRSEFDYRKIKHVIDKDVEPIQSQFRLSVNTVLNLLKRHKEEIHEILCKSFYSYQQFGDAFGQKENLRSHKAFENYVRKLRKLGYVDGEKLTEKGEFASQIYADEILFTEIFATDFYETLSDYQMMLLIAAICFEGKRTEFFKRYSSESLYALKQRIAQHHTLHKDDRFSEMDNLTALIHPVYHGKSVFDILDNVSLLEGDLIRYFRQIVDRIRQLRVATRDRRLSDMLGTIQDKIAHCLKDIDVL